MMSFCSDPHHVHLQRQGWLCSVLFHAIIGTGALALLSNVQVPVHQDSFTWNVAMVEAPKPEPNPEPKSEVLPEPKPTQPKQTKAQPSPPQRVAQPLQQKIVQEPVQAVQQTIQRQVTETVPTPTEVTTVNKTASVITQAVRQSETKQTVAPMTTREPVVQEEQIVTAKVAQAAAPLVTEPTVDRQAAHPVVRHQAIEAAVEQVAQPQQIVQSATVETAAEPVTPPQQTASRQAVETVVERAVTENASATAAPQQHATVEQSLSHVAPTKAVPATKVDYGWLMKALLGRIDQLKNYPHMARLNHWEGKVVLRAVIREDGQVIMVDVHESSGRSILDNDAIETLRKASPLKLDHPLGKPQVAILMPISYSLR